MFSSISLLYQVWRLCPVSDQVKRDLGLTSHLSLNAATLRDSNFVYRHAHTGINTFSLNDSIRNFKSTGFRVLVRIRSDEIYLCQTPTSNQPPVLHSLMKPPECYWRGDLLASGVRIGYAVQSREPMWK